MPASSEPGPADPYGSHGPSPHAGLHAARGGDPNTEAGVGGPRAESRADASDRIATAEPVGPGAEADVSGPNAETGVGGPGLEVQAGADNPIGAAESGDPSAEADAGGSGSAVRAGADGPIGAAESGDPSAEADAGGSGLAVRAGADGPIGAASGDSGGESGGSSAEAEVDSGVVRRSVVLPKHLHARPAGQVAQVAARHRATTIELVAGERRANAVSVLSVMGLGAVTGTEVGILVNGPDAESIADELADILRTPED
jgi:phosphocarrier protein HPr